MKKTSEKIANTKTKKYVKYWKEELDNNYDAKVNDVVLKTTDIKQLNEIDSKIKLNLRKIKIYCFIELYIDKPLKLIFNDGINKIEVLNATLL